jgi:hypothetical protein
MRLPVGTAGTRIFEMADAGREIVASDDDEWPLKDVAIAVGAALFAILLTTTLPDAIRGLTPRAVTGTLAIALLIAETIAKKHALAKMVGRALLTIAAFVLAALPIANTWQGGRGGYFAIGGMLPFSDASNYYQGAVEVKDRAKLDYWNQRRPLNAAMNSLKLRIGGSMRGWTATNAFLLAIGLVLAMREVTRALGGAAAALLLGTVCTHGQEYWFTTMSETNGLLLGLLATAILLAAIRTRSRVWMWTGVFVLALALDARAGAMFILPLLWVWGGFAFGRRWRERMLIGAIAGVVTLTALVPSRLYVKLWANGKGIAHANFALTLYGIAAGNKGWRQAFVDYPQVVNASEPERAAFVYDRAFELIRRNPVRFATTLLWSMLLFIWNTGAFVNQGTTLVGLVLILCLLRRDPLSTLLLAVFAGVTLSAPVLMWDGGARVFAATVPLTALAGALAIGFVQAIIVGAGAKEREMTASPPARRVVPIIATAIAVVFITAPVVLGGRGSIPALPPTPLASEGAAVIFVPGSSGNWLDVFPDRELPKPRVPIVRESGVVRDLMTTELRGVRPDGKPPFSFGLAIDARGAISHGDTMIWFFTPTGVHLPATKRPLMLTGEDRVTSGGQHYLVARRIFELSTDQRRWIERR